MKAIKLILCFFICASCISQTSQDNLSSKNDAKSDVDKKPMSTVYVFENETLKQTVELSFFNEKEIAFKLISQNKKEKQYAQIEGIAKMRGGDVEIDEDAEGNAYPVDEFIYEKNCWLAFRIDRNTKARMRVNETNCNLHSQYCPFASVGLLIKQ